MEHIYLTYTPTDEDRTLAADRKLSEIRSQIWNDPESVVALNTCDRELRAELFANFGFFLGEN